MDIRRHYNLELLRNRGLELVLDRMGALMDARHDFCTCEQCILDLIAYSLNQVTPLYSTSLLEPFKPNPELARRVGLEIELALEEGLKRIARHPNHEEGGDESRT